MSNEANRHKVEALLSEYLGDWKQGKDSGHDMAAVFMLLNEINSTLKENRIEMARLRARVDRHGREIQALKKLQNYKGETDTGSFEVQDIKKELEAQRKKRDEETTWWRRTLIGWVAGIIAFICIQVATVVVTLAMTNPVPHKTPPALPEVRKND